jgi:hypothetical protein
MPKNCSTDAATLMTHIDSILGSSNNQSIVTFKGQFRSNALADDDFAKYERKVSLSIVHSDGTDTRLSCCSAFTLPLHSWQNRQPPDFRIIGEDVFFERCDVLENLGPGRYYTGSTGLATWPSTIQSMLSRCGTWFQSTFVDGDCPDLGGSYFSTYDYNSPAYTNPNPGNKARTWMTCTELGVF